jgi:deazaflavin-dependent oxidoreductase (nitroreductase family)
VTLEEPIRGMAHLIVSNEANMPARNDALRESLSRSQEITISVTGRKSGRTLPIPIWFVFDEQLYLLPVHGSDTQWYKNLLKNPKIRIDAAGSAEAELQAVPITDAAQVRSVVEKFRHKYGANDVKKYYSKFDVAVLVALLFRENDLR